MISWSTDRSRKQAVLEVHSVEGHGIRTPGFNDRVLRLDELAESARLRHINVAVISGPATRALAQGIDKLRAALFWKIVGENRHDI